jgi:hypothetical protein
MPPVSRQGAVFQQETGISRPQGIVLLESLLKYKSRLKFTGVLLALAATLTLM